MSARYTCRHHNAEEHTHGDPAHHKCGCDGTVHMACNPRPAPAGTPRPANWPILLAWRTEPAPPADVSAPAYAPTTEPAEEN